ncbi:MAG TPA: hypothetical protein VMT61_03800 [Candidatus Binataceae bacterium]|nr:hypothetical protein [Candidatus Binataceae bacterium]
MGAPLSTFVRAASDQESVNDAERWVPLPYMVTKTERDQLFAPPVITTEHDFSASILVPPGKVFDPFDLFVLDDKMMLVADDAADGHIWKITTDGKVTPFAAPARYAPYTLDIAPASFGKYRGQIYALAFNEPNAAGGWELADAIVRIDPVTGRDSLVCYLPDNANHEKGAGGFFVRFGPENSPFAGQLWITTASNHSIYTVAPDDTCKFVETIDLDKWGSPRGIAFTTDGTTMLLGSVTPSPANRAKTVEGGGRILRMRPDGTIDEKPFATGLTEPGAMAFAPSSFGHHGGELFVTEVGKWDNDIGITQEPNKGPFAQVHSDGAVYRVTGDGALAKVASGLRNPVGVGFIGDTLIVTDINGDFHEGYQKFPDGFIVAIKAK